MSKLKPNREDKNVIKSQLTHFSQIKDQMLQKTALDNLNKPFNDHLQVILHKIRTIMSELDLLCSKVRDIPEDGDLEATNVHVERIKTEPFGISYFVPIEPSPDLIEPAWLAQAACNSDVKNRSICSNLSNASKHLIDLDQWQDEKKILHLV